MPVRYTQATDGEPQTEDEEIIRVGPHKRLNAVQFLHRKARSAEEKGWTVEWDGKRAFHAWKEYDDGGPVSRKDRYFRVVS